MIDPIFFPTTRHKERETVAAKNRAIYDVWTTYLVSTGQPLISSDWLYPCAGEFTRFLTNR